MVVSKTSVSILFMAFSSGPNWDAAGPAEVPPIQGPADAKGLNWRSVAPCSRASLSSAARKASSLPRQVM